MRIALLYAPPWKIAPPGAAHYPQGEGPPHGHADAVVDGDFLEAPTGMLCLAAQCIRAGHDVRTLNLSALPWPEVLALVARLDADVFGLSVFTANRRGALALAEAIREAHPRACVVLGGPHATALAREIIERCPAVDAVVRGEGEQTFAELLRAVEDHRGFEGIAGVTFRTPLGPRANAERERIRDLDALADYHALWPSPFVLTSRGCPGRCTYCGSQTTWGPRLRAHSVDYTLAMLERCADAGLALVAIKDDTFTADRRRARAVCDAIVARALHRRLVWTCDTRVDALDEETLVAMRRAGCVRLSLGVESADPTVLANIRKRQTPDEIMAITRAAQRCGFAVRYYMMAGNRGETWESFRAGVDFITAARPNEYYYSALSIYPGTEEWALLQRAHGVSADVYFERDFSAMVLFPDTPARDAEQIARWLAAHRGVQHCHDYTVAELEPVAARFEETPAVWADLAAACVREQRFADARAHIARALTLGFPLPELTETYLAAIARAEGDVVAMRAHLVRAARGRPLRHTLANAQAFDAWEQSGCAGDPPAVDIAFDHELACELVQPTNPGPVDPDALEFAPREGQRAATPATVSATAPTGP